MVYLFIHTWCNNEKIRKFAANICWSSRRLQDVFSITVFPLPRRLEDILQDVLKTSGRSKNVTLKTSSRRLEEMSWRCLDDMSWRRFEDMSWRRLEHISWRLLKTCLEDVFKTSWRQTKCLLGISLSNKSK